MPEYLSPGVYVEEVDAGPVPIEGVSTSITGAVGVTAFGPTSGKPVLVTSFAEFMRNFGGFLPNPPSDIYNKWALDQAEGGKWWHFPLAVKGYFDNRGQQLYVKRVFSKSSTASTGRLGQGMVTEIVTDAAANSVVLQVRHLINVDTNLTLQLFRGDTNAQIGGNFRVTSYNGATAQITLNNPVPEALVARRGDFAQIYRIQLPNGNTTLTFTAKNLGNWGNDLSVQVRPMVGSTVNILYDPTIPANSSVSTTVINTANILGPPAATLVTVASVGGFSNGDLILVNGQQYVISNLAAGPPSTFNITPPLVGAQNWAAGTVVQRLNFATTTVVGAVNNPGPPPVTVVTVASAAGFSVGTHLLINGQEYVISATAAGPPSTLTITPQAAGAQSWAAGTAVRSLRRANTPAATPTINVGAASTLYAGAIVELDNGLLKETFTVQSTVGNTVTLSGTPQNQYYEGHKLRVIEAEVDVSYAPANGTTASEAFTNLRLVNDGTRNYLVNNVDQQSSFVRVVAGPGFPAVGGGAAFPANGLNQFPINPNGRWQKLANGNDNLNDLTIDDFVGIDGGSGARTGIQALEDMTDISICVVPGIWSTTVQSALITHCETLRYRFAILDPPDGLSIEGIQAFRTPLDTKYAALYYPWIVVRDPSAQQNVNVAPSAHMAGIYARVDVERGVYKAPANEEILSITKIAQDVNKREQDLLNPVGINALRFFPQRGNRVWGARTLSSNASWKYINVKRLFIYVEASIDYGTQWVVFEPNDQRLWARVRQSIANFLTTVWQNGALFGTKPAEAFFVKCDLTTMTQDDIDNGRLICVIGIAPVYPAEFVIFRIQQKTLDASST